MKKQFRVWMLTDANNNVIAQGRKKEVERVAYHRYVYLHIFSDNLYRTSEWC